MPKFSVKKPFVVLVGVVMLLVLGFVSFTKMTTDFMPNMNMPYMIVITTYPGASPEKVESEVFRLKNGESVPLHLRNKSKIKQEYLSFMTERMHLQE